MKQPPYMTVFWHLENIFKPEKPFKSQKKSAKPKNQTFFSKKLRFFPALVLYGFRLFFSYMLQNTQKHEGILHKFVLICHDT